MSKKDKIKEYEKAEQAAAQDEEAPRNEKDTVKVEVEMDSDDGLQKKLDEALAESQQHYDRLLRVSAEFDNYKKRALREADEFRKFANESLIKDLLHVVDNLERAIDSASESGDANACVVEGVGMTRDEILKTFSKYGVSPVEAVGKPFDPAYHQAIMQEETDEHPENTVVSEMQKGYLLHDRLIRPAMVVVSKAGSSANEGSSNTKTDNEK
jgi:molecular chaperone GrpE